MQTGKRCPGTDLSVRDTLGANFVIAGFLGIASGLDLFFRPGGLLGRASFFALIPAAAMIAAAVMTSHAASRMEDRLSQSARTFPWVIVRGIFSEKTKPGGVFRAQLFTASAVVQW